MATSEKVIEMSNRLKSIKSSDNPEVNHIIAGTDDIFDDSKRKKQSQINSEVETRLNAYETGKFVNVETYAELPAPGEVDTIYRVANWDGEQVDTTKYAEYSWDGTQYMLLGVNKNDDVIRTDISQSLSDAEKKQARENLGMGNGDFAVASDFTNPDATKRAKVPTVGAIVDGLNDGIYDVSKRNPTGGPNNDGKFTLDYILNQNNVNTLIPTGWRHGGMSIKFVQSSDNKYVQYRLTASEFTTDINAWVDEDNLSLHTIESNESLNFVDRNGNVVLNVKDGQVRTKNFDSRAVAPKNDLLELSDREKQDVESLTAAINNKQENADIKESVESLNLADESDNVVLRVKNGEIRTRRFDSTTVASKYDVLALSQQLKQKTQSLQNAIDGKQNAGNYVEEEIGRDATKLYFKDEEGNVVAEFAAGEIMTKHFNSKSALVSKGKSQNLNLIDSFGNVILSIKDGYIATSNFKSKGLSTLLNSLLGRIMNIEKDDVLLNRKMIPAISWVDDDFATESAKIGCLTIYRNWCNSNNIHGDIALIPDAVIDRQNQDISRVYFTDDRKALLEAFENEGFEFLVHPPHDGLYTGGGWNTQWSDEYIRKNLAMTVRCFLENNLVPDILVYPGASGGVAEVIKCAKKYFTCAIQPSGGAVGIPTNRYNLKRVNMDNISAERTVTQIKQEIASAISNGYWVILCSHVWMCTGDGTEATDETSMSFANLFDIVTYANTLSAIKPVRQVWRDRSILWDYYTNIN